MAEDQKKDTRTRKWQLTFNNPIDYGFTHDKIKDIISSNFSSVAYWCLCDEIGLENHTPHTHLFLLGNNVIRFSQIQKNFPGVHTEMCRGTCQDNLDYIRKEGKYEKDKKKETNLINTFEDFGTMPIERQGQRSDVEDILDMIKSGASDLDIIEQIPSVMYNLEKLESVRQCYLSKKFCNVFRKLDVTYIYGSTGVGKSRFVCDLYGFENVFRVTNYKFHPFDGYKGQDVIVFDEYRSSFFLADILNYLDGYPLELPCRFKDKQACFTKVYIISNIPLELQYKNIQEEEPASWCAFLRRIQHCFCMQNDGTMIEEVIDSNKVAKNISYKKKKNDYGNLSIFEDNDDELPF